MNSTLKSPAERTAPDTLRPDWTAPGRVHGFVTLRRGGVSSGPWGLQGGEAGGWNLGAHCGDAPHDVARNRAVLRDLLPAEPVWLDQVHGTEVFDADASAPCAVPPVADAAVTVCRGRVLAVMTADCLPVLLTNRSGAAVGIAHAGWRGLCAGVLESTVAALASRTADHDWIAWLGPAIGPRRFEVGEEVREAFVAHDPLAADGFTATGRPGKWLGDLPALARRRLADAGVASVFGGHLCTVEDPGRFYSFRRDRQTGRMASLIWLA